MNKHSNTYIDMKKKVNIVHYFSFLHLVFNTHLSSLKQIKFIVIVPGVRSLKWVSLC